MKKLTIIVSLVFTSNFLLSQWITLSPYPTSNHLNDVVFIDQDIGWICGEEGTILYTNDGGEKWVHQESSTLQDLIKMTVIDDQNVWIVGDNGTILSTVDGGQNWVDFSTSDSLYWRSVDFKNLNVGWIVGGTSSGQGIIMHTVDAGINWQTQYIVPGNGFNDLFFTSLTSGWVVGSHSIVHTNDGGESWSEQYYFNWFGFNAVWFNDSLDGWAVGGYSDILLHTTDGGINWVTDTVYLQMNNIITDIRFTDPMHGWISSNGGEPGSTCLLVSTENGGETWNIIPTSNLVFSDEIYGFHFLDQETGWVVGYCGNIASTEDGLSWYKQSKMINDKYITDISFFDDQHGIGLANIGYILDMSIFVKTENGGEDWEFLSEFWDWTHKMFVVDESNIWVRGDYFIHHTSNGGITWDDSDPFEGYVVTDIFFTDANNGWATDWDIPYDISRIYHTTNEGEYWEEQYTGEGELLKTIYFHDQNTGWIAGKAGDSGVIIHTSNGGETWSHQLFAIDQSFAKIHFSGINHGTAIGYHGSVFKTYNGGETWAQITNNFDIDVADVFVAGPDHIWIVGRKGQYPQPVFEGLIYYSNDGGQTWDEQFSGTDSELYGIWFNDSENGWISGSNGTILHTENGGITNTAKTKMPDSKNQLLAYPNPFNSITNIKFELYKKGFVELSVYTLEGKQCKVFVSEALSIGEYQYSWNAEGLPAGVYLITLKTNNVVHSRRMLKL